MEIKKNKRWRAYFLRLKLLCFYISYELVTVFTLSLSQLTANWIRCHKNVQILQETGLVCIMSTNYCVSYWKTLTINEGNKRFQILYSNKYFVHLVCRRVCLGSCHLQDWWSAVSRRGSCCPVLPCCWHCWVAPHSLGCGPSPWDQRRGCCDGTCAPTRWSQLRWPTEPWQLPHRSARRSEWGTRGHGRVLAL